MATITLPKKKTSAPVINPAPAFSYAVLPADVAEDAKMTADAIRAELHTSAVAAVDIGKHLHDIKDKFPHGQFGAWVSAEFGWSHRTANDFMNMHRLVKEQGEFIDLPLKALRALSAPSVPESVKQAVLDKIENGKAPDADSIIASIKQDKPAKDAPKTTGKAKADPAKDAALEAVGLLIKRLGSDYAEFSKLFRKAGPVFAKELRKAVPAHA